VTAIRVTENKLEYIVFEEEKRKKNMAVEGRITILDVGLIAVVVLLGPVAGK